MTANKQYNLQGTLFDVSNKVLVVTGAAGFLGTQYVASLLASGAKIVALDLNVAGLEILSKSTASEWIANLLCIKADVTDYVAMEQAAQTILDRFGRIDGLLNSAAKDPKFDREETKKRKGSFEEYPVEAWRESIDITLTGTFICCQVFGRVMAETSDNGSIINVGSTYGIVSPNPSLYEQAFPETGLFKPPCYAVAKAGVIHLTRYLSAHWKGKVRVNCICPGGIENEQPEQFKAVYASMTPSGRMGLPNEMIGAVIFLFSQASAYMNGANLSIDGGWTAS